MFIATAAYAKASSYAILYDSEYEKSNGFVGRGLHGYAYEGNLESYSHYSVRFTMFVGPNSGNCGIELTHMDRGPREAFRPFHESCSSTYTVGKVTMYGSTL